MSQHSPQRSSVGKDPFHSKMHLSNFSQTGIRQSSIAMRQSEAQDELYCELCRKIFKITEFRGHFQQHRRKPRPKIDYLIRQNKDIRQVALNFAVSSGKSITGTDMLLQPQLKPISKQQRNSPHRLTHNQTTEHNTTFHSPQKTNLPFYPNQLNHRDVLYIEIHKNLYEIAFENQHGKEYYLPHHSKKIF